MEQLKSTTEIKQLRTIIESITSDAKNIVEKCIKAGELLTRIKANTKYGDWDAVLQSVDLSFKTAQRYMAVWEHRSQLQLKEIKTLSDAENAIYSIGSLPIPTSQNEGLTHEKTSNPATPKRPDSGHDNENVRRRNATKRTEETETKARRSAFDADPIPRDNSRAYLSDIDPADKISKATPADVVVARAVVLPTESN